MLTIHLYEQTTVLTTVLLTCYKYYIYLLLFLIYISVQTIAVGHPIYMCAPVLEF